MKSFLMTCACGLASLGLLALLIHPDVGVMYDRPGVAVGVGLIGLGLCVEARKRMAS